jgi:hypothetical protein
MRLGVGRSSVPTRLSMTAGSALRARVTGLVSKAQVEVEVGRAAEVGEHLAGADQFGVEVGQQPLGQVGVAGGVGQGEALALADAPFPQKSAGKGASSQRLSPRR